MTFVLIFSIERKIEVSISKGWIHRSREDIELVEKDGNTNFVASSGSSSNLLLVNFVILIFVLRHCDLLLNRLKSIVQLNVKLLTNFFKIIFVFAYRVASSCKYNCK